MNILLATYLNSSKCDRYIIFFKWLIDSGKRGNVVKEWPKVFAGG